MLQAREPVDSLEASNVGNASLQEFIMTAMNIRASYYTMVAGFVIYIWDILLTLKDEQDLLWTKDGRFMKILYLTVSLAPSRNSEQFDAQWIDRIVICHFLDYFLSSMVRFYIRDALRNDRRAPTIPVNNPIRTWALTDNVRYHRHASPLLLTDAHDYRCKRLLRATSSIFKKPYTL
jgi:hypothetical protein